MRKARVFGATAALANRNLLHCVLRGHGAMLPSDADTLYTVLSTPHHPVQHLSVHRVDLHRQLHAVKANATMLLFTHGRIAGTGSTCLESVVVHPESYRTKRGACRHTESSFGGTFCSGRETIALHRLMLEDGLPRRGDVRGTQGTGTLFLIQAN